MKAEPELKADSVLTMYLDKLKTQVIEDGCINQSPAGCVLPRNMQGDVCNLYYCDPLLAYQQGTQRTGPATDGVIDPVVAVQRANNAWNRLKPSTSREVISVAVIDQHETRQLRLNELDT